MILSKRNRLREITIALLEKEDNFLTLKENIQKLKALFLEASQLTEEDEQNRINISLASGKAIGPTWAAMCVDDMLRTKKFICGVDAAIQKKIGEKNKKPVSILYVGPGPFGTLVMPLISKYSPAEIEFIFFEVNPVTASYLKKTVAFFNAEEYVREIKVCDAASVQVTNPQNTDVLVVECLQRALEEEPQVAITYNLLHQLNKDVIMIPEDISLSVALSNTKKQQQLLTNKTHSYKDYTTFFDPFLSLNKINVLNHNNPSHLLFEEQKITFTKQQLEAYDTISIVTTITLFKAIKLVYQQSGLTIPLLVARLKEDPAISGIKTTYKTGEKPFVATTILKE